ncbi:MAG: twin-arginine translocase subunit TatC [Planctomycetales bacterium]|nr:twin-arginine translocase subunit TatC [Planctomycetales bacterium]
MPKQVHDDNFEGGVSMSFGDHLEELRKSLFKALAGLIVTGIIGFVMAESVVKFFQQPLERAMTNYLRTRAELKLEKELGVKPLPLEIQDMLHKRNLIPEHLEVETGKLIESLKAAIPELQQLELSANTFGPSDIKPAGITEFCSALVTSGGTKEATPAKRIWMLLSEDQKKQVRILSEQTGEVDSAGVNRILAILNSLTSKRELHDSAEFLELTGQDAVTTTSIREGLKAKFDREQSRRLNKMLLAAQFPSAIEPPHVAMIPLAAWKPIAVRFLVLNAQEAFMIWMKAALVTGLVLGSPWIFIQIWNFVAAGLYPHEKNYVYMYLPISILLFFGGASLAYLFVFDPVLNFLFMFNTSMNAEFDPRIGEWLSFVLILPLGFGIGFQLPLVMLFLNRIGILSIELYIQQWRIAILSIFVIAMVLTPADPYSMLLMAIPLCLLYVVGILVCKWMPKGRNPFAEAYEV